MHEPQRKRDPGLDQTWPRRRLRVGTVQTVRVKVIGAAETPDYAASISRPGIFSKTFRYGNTLPSFEDCILHDSAACEAHEIWQDVSHLLDAEDARQRALAMADTLPSFSVDTFAAENSGVRAIEQLPSWSESRDRAPVAAPHHERTPDSATTLRLRALKPAALSRAWQAWERQPALVAFCTTLTVCAISALAISMLAR